jgi:hypothetical protein
MSGFAMIYGFYYLSDERFDFLSEISFTVMLVTGFICTNAIKLLPNPFPSIDSNLKILVIAALSGIIGAVLALLRNTVGKWITNKLIIRFVRRKSASPLFWYHLLDKPSKPMWIRLRNNEHKYMIEGLLVSLDEANENPYLELCNCRRLDLFGCVIDDKDANDIQKHYVVRADSFDEIQIIYDKKSDMLVNISINETQED